MALALQTRHLLMHVTVVSVFNIHFKIGKLTKIFFFYVACRVICDWVKWDVVYIYLVLKSFLTDPV